MSDPIVEHHVAHHFDSAEQEFDAAKIGMWLFLVTEIMLFGGLFVGYVVYRGWNFDLWFNASKYILSTWQGALNTVVLIVSSYTMVMSVYCAQTDNRKGLLRNLMLTFLCAGAFMVVKGFEYYSKWDHNALPITIKQEYIGNEKQETAAFVADKNTYSVNAPQPVVRRRFTLHSDDETDPVKKAEKKKIEEYFNTGENAKHLSVFMGFYFTMTGIHGLHILIGMGLIAWLYVRAKKGHFHSKFFTPVEMVGLYWHVVDLIWIFLFPLFYLVG